MKLFTIIVYASAGHMCSVCHTPFGLIPLNVVFIYKYRVFHIVHFLVLQIAAMMILWNSTQNCKLELADRETNFLLMLSVREIGVSSSKV